MNFEDAFTYVIGNEGGYSNNPADPGGETMYGVTKRVAAQHGYTGEMKDLTLEQARAIAKAGYWDTVRGDEMPYDVAEQVFDASYNSGPSQAIKWLQAAVDATVDGIFGSGTMAAVQAATPAVLIARFNGYRLDFLASLSTWQTFGKGWARRIVRNLLRVTK